MSRMTHRRALKMKRASQCKEKDRPMSCTVFVVQSEFTSQLAAQLFLPLFRVTSRGSSMLAATSCCCWGLPERWWNSVVTGGCLVDVWWCPFRVRSISASCGRSLVIKTSPRSTGLAQILGGVAHRHFILSGDLSQDTEYLRTHDNLGLDTKDLWTLSRISWSRLFWRLFVYLRRISFSGVKVLGGAWKSENRRWLITFSRNIDQLVANISLECNERALILSPDKKISLLLQV